MRLPRKPSLADKNPLSVAGKAIQDMAAGIDDVAHDVDQALSRLGKPEAAESPLEPAEMEEALAPITNLATLAWQIEHLLDDVEHLEVDHLPGKGRINGSPCDCIAKGGRTTRRHAIETVPIAARQDVDARIFSEIAQWANHLVDIGTLDAVQSGKYDDEYLRQAGTASNYRKTLEKILAEFKKSHREQCATCPPGLDMKKFIDRHRKERPS
jgi:hypothetical protein